MRDRGDGTSFWDKNKQRFTVRVPLGNGKKLTGTAKTKPEARALLATLRERAGKAAEAEGSSQTVAQYLRFWLNVRRQAGLRLKTDEFYTRGVEKLLIPYLGEFELTKLNAMHVLQAYERMGKAGVSKAGQGAAHATLSTALTYAVAPLRIIPHNVIEGVKKPRGPRREYIVWTPEQMAAFEAKARGDWYEALYTMAIRTGAREGELLALHWDHIDLKAAQAHIEYTLTEVAGVVRGRFETKTKASKRALDLDPEIVAALRRQKERLMAAGLAATQLVFPTREGTYPLKHNVLRGFKLLAAKAGVPVIRFHDQRHSHASYLMSIGINPAAVAARLGQSGTSTLFGTYTHVSLDHQKRISETFADAVATAAGALSPKVDSLTSKKGRE